MVQPSATAERDLVSGVWLTFGVLATRDTGRRSGSQRQKKWGPMSGGEGKWIAFGNGNREYRNGLAVRENRMHQIRYEPQSP
jgi:hypothetical protein